VIELGGDAVALRDSNKITRQTFDLPECPPRMRSASLRSSSWASAR
jgi:hypothetical protein